MYSNSGPCYDLHTVMPSHSHSAFWKKAPDSFTAFLEMQRVRLRRWNLRRAVLQGQIIKRGKNWGLSKWMRESERGVKRRRKHGSCLFRHPSVRSAGGALFTQLCMCVGVGGGGWGGQEEREGKRKSGEMVEGGGTGGSRWSLLKGIMGEERIAMAAM